MRLTQRCLVIVPSLLLATAVLAPAARAHDLVGFRGGVYTKIDKPFVGVELLLPLDHRVYLNPNVEYVFIENNTYMTFNADFHYDFPTRSRASFYLGGGLGILYVNPDGPAPSDTNVGANFLGGVAFTGGSVIPYFQAKLFVRDETEFVVAFGLRF